MIQKKCDIANFTLGFSFKQNNDDKRNKCHISRLPKRIKSKRTWLCTQTTSGLPNRHSSPHLCEFLSSHVWDHVHAYPEIYFSANILLRIRKFSRPYAAYSNRFQPSTCFRLYPEIFWFALVLSSFAGENPEMSMRIIAILASFLPHHSYCKV